jgi:transmembrane sensor
MNDRTPSGDMLSAREIRERAAAWLERIESADWHSEDRTALDAWLVEAPAHRVAYLRAHDAWKRADRLSALQGAVRGDVLAKQGRFSLLGKIAIGIFSVAIASAAAAIYFSAPRAQSYATTVGGHETLVLADGSQIEMNTDTVLRTSLGRTRRTVWLDRGEAYFAIKHDAARPFVIIAGDHRIADLGTKFVVRRDTGYLEVALMEGRARLESVQEGSPPAVLVPGDFAVATAKTVSVIHKSSDELVANLSWRQGVLTFKHTTLAAAVAEFNRYNQTKLVVADSSVANLQIGGTFPIDNVELFGHIAQTILGVRVQKQGDEIVISR